jgi:TetR/AcrR family transcriptional repressor of lmrAB and yxaGH operons
MIETAGSLLRREGYAATGWRKVVEESGTPWGSQHHHFPGGKEQLAAEAVRLGGDASNAALAHALSKSATVADGVRLYIKLATKQLVASEYRDGCPVATVALEMTPASPGLTDVCAAALNAWGHTLEIALGEAGVGDARARELATLVVLSIEGALLLARVRRDPGPLTVASDAIGRLLDDELATHSSCATTTPCPATSSPSTGVGR